MGSGLLTPGHLIIVLVIALLVLGPKRLPELGRSLGSGMRGFKDAIEGEEEEEDKVAAGSAVAELTAEQTVSSPRTDPAKASHEADEQAVRTTSTTTPPPS